MGLPNPPKGRKNKTKYTSGHHLFPQTTLVVIQAKSTILHINTKNTLLDINFQSQKTPLFSIIELLISQQKI